MSPSPLKPSRRQILSWAGALAAAAGTNPGYAAEPRRGGTLSLLLAAEPPTISAVAHTAYNTVIVAAKVQEGLLTYGFDLTPKPQLAVGWDVAEDGLSYVFKLRPGVKWHDGKDFTSADVAFSINALKSMHPRGRSTFANVSEIRTPDPHTVVLVLAKPAPYLLSAFAAAETPIVPKHIYENAGPVDANPANNAPIGTGPFVFKEWVRGSHILYEKNPAYWDAGKPYIDRLIVRIIPDAIARVTAIETGEIQLAPNSPIPLSDAERLKALPALAFETNSYQYTNTISRVEFNLDRPIFRDVRVRRAFAHAIDRKVIRDVVNYGYGKIIVGPVSASLTKFYVDDLKSYPFDLKAAEKLLDEAGYARGADGIRFRLTHDYVPSGDLYRRGADYIKQALAKIGVEVTVRTQDFPTYTKRVYTDRDFDFTFNGMSNLFDPTVGIQRLYWSKNFKPGVPFSNGSHYSNPEVDRLLEVASTEADPKKRYDEFAAFQRILAEDLPDFGVLSSGEFTVYSRNIDGHTVGADGVSGNLADVHFVK
ncbi:ABC transporter substrate-binding protein [Bradyrhizobium sp. 48]|uniref:ABC transporter substrate-binding protein n=1 Tax=Bradyrhizobium sp. 48 TaxID=2782676 RepID=UPI001FF91B7B|nr:ABC transporter substrate-binding protein [Bradyrhizobium sp. 48]MCK1441694.1 ABC transporter substrate-binding protein [Bradyrhizobium sp. 48]